MNNFQKLSPESLNEATRLFIKVFNDSPWSESWNEISAYAKLHQLYSTPGFSGYGMYDKEQLIGFCAGYKEIWDQGQNFYLLEFCISNGLQGKGLGSELLAFLELKLKEEGICNIYLLTMRNGVAEKFYKKNGYQVNQQIVLMDKKL
ncbi:GNAT family N-acetyltransferase [Cytophagaceae bacterium ABcell3]|nr:GNAT family N-acetyltransferase [Cytophagaceae bacterium ABcell3]